jgi:hypothetical protein
VRILINIFFYLLFLALSYYALLILPKRVTRKTLEYGLVAAYVIFSLLNILSSETIPEWLNPIFQSFIMLMMLSIGRELSIVIIDFVNRFHIENNSSNLNVTPLRQLIKYQGQIKKGYTWVIFIISVMALKHTWFSGK